MTRMIDPPADRQDGDGAQTTDVVRAAANREELARVIFDGDHRTADYVKEPVWRRHKSVYLARADAVLASDWLADFGNYAHHEGFGRGVEWADQWRDNTPGSPAERPGGDA